MADLATSLRNFKREPANNSIPVFFTLTGREDQLEFYPKSSPGGINIKDRYAVEGAFKAFKFWNRFDLVQALDEFIRKEGDESPKGALDPLASGEMARIGERGKVDWIQKQYLTGCPALPQGAGTLTFHRGSVIAFLQCSVGHGLTGIVNISRAKVTNKVRPKIFLVPIQPSVSNQGKAYPVRPQVQIETRIYNTSIKPIVHQQSGMGQASHTQVTDEIRRNEKYEKLTQLNGDFVGFTLIKGDGRNGVGNRYGFTSASSNTHSFHLFEGYKHSNCTTEEWGRFIALACDELLKLDANEEHRAMVLADDRQKWEIVKRIYWPCEVPKVTVAESIENASEPDDEDEWK